MTDSSFFRENADMIGFGVMCAAFAVLLYESSLVFWSDPMKIWYDGLCICTMFTGSAVAIFRGN